MMLDAILVRLHLHLVGEIPHLRAGRPLDTAACSGCRRCSGVCGCISCHAVGTERRRQTVSSRIDVLVAGVAGVVVVSFLLLGVLAALGINVGSPAAAVSTEADGGGSASGGYGAPALASSGEAAPLPGSLRFEERQAWYEGEPVLYYDLGAESSLDNDAVQDAKIWVFVYGFDDEGAPRFIEGHPTIVDVVPGDDGYSDLWHVQLVIVPGGRDTSGIRSRDALLASDLEIISTDMLVNCPIVPLGSTFTDGQALNDAWYRGERVVYATFGVTLATPIPVWTFITGFDGAGRPIVVPGQDPVTDKGPVDDGYSQFQRVYYVTVDAEYEANSIRSAAAIVASGYGVTPTAIVLNRPVVEGG